MTQILRTILSPLKMSSLSSSSSEGAACKSCLAHCRYMIMKSTPYLTSHPIPLWFWTPGSWVLIQGARGCFKNVVQASRAHGFTEAPLCLPSSKPKPRLTWGSAPCCLQLFSPKPLIWLPWQPHLLSANAQCPLFLTIWNQNPSQFTQNSFNS